MRARRRTTKKKIILLIKKNTKRSDRVGIIWNLNTSYWIESEAIFEDPTSNKMIVFFEFHIEA